MGTGKIQSSASFFTKRKSSVHVGCTKLSERNIQSNQILTQRNIESNFHPLITRTLEGGAHTTEPFTTAVICVVLADVSSFHAEVTGLKQLFSFPENGELLAIIRSSLPSIFTYA